MQNYDPYLNTYNTPYNTSEPYNSNPYQDNQMPDSHYEDGGYDDPYMSYGNAYDTDGQQYSFREGGAVEKGNSNFPRLVDVIGEEEAVRSDIVNKAKELSQMVINEALNANNGKLDEPTLINKFTEIGNSLNLNEAEKNQVERFVENIFKNYQFNDSPGYFYEKAHGMTNNKPIQSSFKRGGSVGDEDLPKLADLIRRHGRNGDTELAHINPIEAHILKSLGGSGTINPATGLREFAPGGTSSAPFRQGYSGANSQFSFQNNLNYSSPFTNGYNPQITLNSYKPIQEYKPINSYRAVETSLNKPIDYKPQTPYKIIENKLLNPQPSNRYEPQTPYDTVENGILNYKPVNTDNNRTLPQTYNFLPPNVGISAGDEEKAKYKARERNYYNNYYNNHINTYSTKKNKYKDDRGFWEKLADNTMDYLSEPEKLLGLGTLYLNYKNRPKEKTPEQKADEERRYKNASRQTIAEVLEDAKIEKAREEEKEKLEEEKEKRKKKKKEKELEEDIKNMGSVRRRVLSPEEFARTGRWLEYEDEEGRPVRMKGGGSAHSPYAYLMEETYYPRSPIGYLKGNSGGQDDLINARLSDGEYVFDASTVSDLGDGNNAAGARKLDVFRENLRKHKRGGQVTLPPKAKSLQNYLMG